MDDDSRPVTIDIETATESTITDADLTRLRSEAGLTSEAAPPRTIPEGASSDVAYEVPAGTDVSEDHDIDEALAQRGRETEEAQDADVPEGAAREDEVPS